MSFPRKRDSIFPGSSMSFPRKRESILKRRLLEVFTMQNNLHKEKMDPRFRGDDMNIQR
jgi:hypothetical protein